MSSDQDRDPPSSLEANANTRRYRREAAGAWFLGLVVLVVLSALVIFSLLRGTGSTRHVAEHAAEGAPSTTGSGHARSRQ